jgi:hypothetical protein
MKKTDNAAGTAASSKSSLQGQITALIVDHALKMYYTHSR